MRIKPGVQVLSLVEGTIQIGTGQHARWITGLSAAERRFVLSLATGAPPSPSAPISGDVLKKGRRSEILGILAPVLVPSVPHSGKDVEAALGKGLGARMMPDVLQWSSAYRLDATRALKARSESRVALYGCGRTGQLLAHILAAAGVGGLMLSDSEDFDAEDLGAATAGITAVGTQRARATARSLQPLYPHLAVAESAVRSPGAPPLDISVVIGEGALPPVHSLAQDEAMIPVLFTDAGVRIGPMSIDGLSMCAPCVWEQCDPTVRMLDNHAGENKRQLLRPEASLAAVTAGVTAMQVLMLIDRINVPTTVDSMITWDLSTGGGSSTPAKQRPHCTCLDGRAA